MKLKYFTILITFFLSASLFSQTSLNNYKYVVVPNKFDFLKEQDQYQLNSLTQFLFNKYGFIALMEGSNYPEDALKNRCLVLKSNLLKDGSMFKTKLAVELKNCNDQVVFTSEVGESREKEYHRAYNEAVRGAFKSIEALNYKYAPITSATNSQVVTSQAIEVKSEVSNEIQQLKEEIKNLKKEKENVAPETMTLKSETISVSHNLAFKNDASSILYAQAIENGFQLVDITPKVVYKIKKTSIPNVYLVENKNATLSKKGSEWVLEYYENDVLKQDVLNIKF